MLITSSRKPSARTRTLCANLASFFNCEYLIRGKRSLSELLSLSGKDTVVLIGDYHGNPGSFLCYGNTGDEIFSIHMSVYYPDDCKFNNLKSLSPVFIGNVKLASLFSHYFDIAPLNSDSAAKCIIFGKNFIEFKYFEKLLFRINIKNVHYLM